MELGLNVGYVNEKYKVNESWGIRYKQVACLHKMKHGNGCSLVAGSLKKEPTFSTESIIK